MGRRLEGWARTVLLVSLVATIFAVAAAWPSRERVGAAAEGLTKWWQGDPRKRPVERHELGKAKRARLEWFSRSSGPASAVPASPAPVPR